MGWGETIALAILQGLTEFLPVSSSGHLGLLQRWFSAFRETDLPYAIVLHLGTAVALLVYFRGDLLRLLRGVRRPGTVDGSAFPAGGERAYLLRILLGSVPTVVLGLCLEPAARYTLARPAWIGAFLLVTGTLLLGPRLRPAPSPGKSRITIGRALLVGAVQGLAVLPGISRSGSTIVAGILSGLERNRAARFSFHLSLPAVFGAALLEAVRLPSLPQILSIHFLVGFLVAAASGYLAIGWLLRAVDAGRLEWFSPYCWGLGLLVLAGIGLEGSW